MRFGATSSSMKRSASSATVIALFASAASAAGSPPAATRPRMRFASLRASTGVMTPLRPILTHGLRPPPLGR